MVFDIEFIITEFCFEHWFAQWTSKCVRMSFVSFHFNFFSFSWIWICTVLPFQFCIYYTYILFLRSPFAPQSGRTVFKLNWLYSMPIYNLCSTHSIQILNFTFIWSAAYIIFYKHRLQSMQLQSRRQEYNEFQTTTKNKMKIKRDIYAECQLIILCLFVLSLALSFALYSSPQHFFTFNFVPFMVNAVHSINIYAIEPLTEKVSRISMNGKKLVKKTQHFYHIFLKVIACQSLICWLKFRISRT